MEPSTMWTTLFLSRFFVFHPLVLLLSPHDKYAINHPLHHRPNHDRLNFIWDIEVRQFIAPTDYFLLIGIHPLSCKTYPAEFSNVFLHKRGAEALAAAHSDLRCYYNKITPTCGVPSFSDGTPQGSE